MKKDRNFFEKEKIVVPFFRPYINSDDRNYVQKSLRSHILTKFLRNFLTKIRVNSKSMSKSKIFQINIIFQLWRLHLKL